MIVTGVHNYQFQNQPGIEPLAGRETARLQSCEVCSDSSPLVLALFTKRSIQNMILDVFPLVTLQSGAVNYLTVLLVHKERTRICCEGDILRETMHKTSHRSLIFVSKTKKLTSRVPCRGHHRMKRRRCSINAVFLNTEVIQEVQMPSHAAPKLTNEPSVCKGIENMPYFH